MKQDNKETGQDIQILSRGNWFPPVGGGRRYRKSCGHPSVFGSHHRRRRRRPASCQQQKYVCQSKPIITAQKREKSIV